MPELRVYRGVPGSGKTTASREWVAESPLTRVRVNRDDLRMMFYGKKIDLAHEQEIQINRAEESLTRTYLAKGQGVDTIPCPDRLKSSNTERESHDCCRASR